MSNEHDERRTGEAKSPEPFEHGHIVQVRALVIEVDDDRLFVNFDGSKMGGAWVPKVAAKHEHWMVEEIAQIERDAKELQATFGSPRPNEDQISAPSSESAVTRERGAPDAPSPGNQSGLAGPSGLASGTISRPSDAQSPLGPRPCGNPECSVSSAVDESLTFGSGDLDDYGFWEKPCGTCARAHEAAYPGDGPCWPFKDRDPKNRRTSEARDLSAVTRPAYEAHGVRLYLGDAASIIPTLEEPIDLLATDPPWGVGYESHGYRIKAPTFGVIHGDRGEVDVAAILNACAGKMRRKRHAYVFGPRSLLDGVATLTAHTELIWDKERTGTGNLEMPWGPAHEVITFAVREPSAACRARGDGRLSARMRKGSVLRFQRPDKSAASPHPNEKPVDLMRSIVESSSCHGDLVVDPFMGSGATIVAALLEGRRAIGIEIDERYFDAAKRRVEALLPTLRELESA